MADLLKGSSTLRLGWRILILAVMEVSAIKTETPQSRCALLGAGVDGQALVNRYCLDCHSTSLKTGGLALEGLDIHQVSGHADEWEKVLRNVRSGEMPPRGLPRPTPAEYTAFGQSLEQSLDSASATNPNPGRPAIHRLNRTEYSNAIRDLFGLDIQSVASLPAA